MESERGGDVSGKVRGVVAAGIEMKFVRDFAGREEPVERNGAGVESVVVLIAAVEINLQGRKIGGARQDQRAVGVPEGGVRRNAENTTEDASARGLRCAEEDGKFFDERGAVRTDSNKKLRMAEGEMECTVTAHGHARDGPVGAARRNAIALFDERKKFLKEEIFVANFPVF